MRAPALVIEPYLMSTLDEALARLSLGSSPTRSPPPKIKTIEGVSSLDLLISLAEDHGPSNNRVYFHPSDLTRLNLCAGDLVQLTMPEEQESVAGNVAIAWPRLSCVAGEIKVVALQLQNFGLLENERARAKPFVQISPITTALSISVRCPDNSQLDVQQVRFGLANLSFLSIECVYELVVDGVCRAVRIETANGGHIARGAIFKASSKTNTTMWQKDPEESNADESLLIGGLDEPFNMIMQIISQPLRHQELFSKFKIKPLRGILLYGPPGTGKTLLARNLAQKLKLYTVFVDAAEVVGKYYGESEAKLRNIFAEARANQPSLIFIDEADALCPKRDSNTNRVEGRIVATLLTLLDGIDSATDSGAELVFVLAATNSPDSIDPALRRPGRFDKEIEIGIPNTLQRLEILCKYVDRTIHNLSRDQLVELSARMHGYVGADIAAVCKEAKFHALKRMTASKDSRDIAVNYADISSAIALIRPSSLREVALEIPRVLWADIGGQHSTKQKLRESIEWPLMYPERFARMGIRPPKGILLYGPPGCSKTLMAKAMATESSLNFLAVKGPELFSKWVGDSEKQIREIFRKARAAAPSILFFDEFDAVASKRGSDGTASSVTDRVLCQLLSEMDGIDPLVSVIVVAATNRPDILDPAVLRPGRFDRHIYIAPPDLESRKEIFQIQFRKMSFDNNVSADIMAEKTNGYSGAEIVAICQEAGLAALERNPDATAISSADLDAALHSMPPRISKSTTEYFERLDRRRF